MALIILSSSPLLVCDFPPKKTLVCYYYHPISQVVLRLMMQGLSRSSSMPQARALFRLVVCEPRARIRLTFYLCFLSVTGS